MKKILIKNRLTIAIIFILLGMQLPRWLRNNQKLERNLKQQTYSVISSQQNLTSIEFPLTEQRKIVLFWASWCAPCKIEMRRLKASVEDGKISSHELIAIAPFEDTKTIKQYLKNNSYPFTFVDASALAEELEISVVPTTLFINDQKITSFQSGMSILGIWRAEWFVRSR